MALILIVDDDATNRELLHAYLDENGHVLLDADSGEEAIRIARESSPDIVLLDVMMKGLSGFETARLLKDQAGEEFLPIILLTSLSDQQSRILGLQMGADEFLTKPVDRFELDIRIKNLLALRAKGRQLETQRREAEEANRVKGAFLANMSHELRTPLNAILGFTQLMHAGQAGVVSPLQHEFLGLVLTSAQHLLRLINDILDLAKVESGKMELRPELVDVSVVIEETVGILRELAAAKHLRLETYIDPIVRNIITDPSRLRQVLYNYLSNAIKFTPENGRVAVRATPEAADLIRLEVEDTGNGISVTDLGRLFVEFQQLDGGMATQNQGTGLGLALTKRIAEAQGGRVEVRSMLGQGSTFAAILPRGPSIPIPTSS